MSKAFGGKRLVWGLGLGAVALGAALLSGGVSGDPAAEGEAAAVIAQGGGDAEMLVPASYAAQDGGEAKGEADPAQGPRPGGGQAEQALEGLAQIRQQQCQMGNHLACQSMPSIPGIRRQLADHGAACARGRAEGCSAYEALAQKIFTAYTESAAVMQQGEAAMARMDAWRGQMNRNAAASMDNLRARAAAGQAAHEARQERYAAMNRSWQAGQDSMDRAHGRTIDRIYEGTTMDRGGVQARIPDGSVGYTDGYGNVIAVPEGQRAPEGWAPMNPSYAPPR